MENGEELLYSSYFSLFSAIFTFWWRISPASFLLMEIIISLKSHQVIRPPVSESPLKCLRGDHRDDAGSLYTVPYFHRTIFHDYLLPAEFKSEQFELLDYLTISKTRQSPHDQASTTNG